MSNFPDFKLPDINLPDLNLPDITPTDYEKYSFFIESFKEGLVIDIEGESQDDKAQAMLFNRKTEKQGTLNERFHIVLQSNGSYKLKVLHSRKSLCVKDGDNAITQEEFDHKPHQQWFIEPTDDGYVMFRNEKTGKYIDVPAQKFQAGNKLCEYAGNKSNAQKFKLIKAQPLEKK
jgi:hypothetical protein